MPVQVLKQADNGWWEGELQSRGKKRAVGWFPANRVELLPQRVSSKSSLTSPFHNVGGVAFEGKVARCKSVSHTDTVEYYITYAYHQHDPEVTIIDMCMYTCAYTVEPGHYVFLYIYYT